MKISKKKRNIILGTFTLICVFIIHLFSNQYLKNKNSIYWKKNLELKLNDFCGEIDNNSKNKINWYHELYLNSSVTSNGKMVALFDKNKSWIKDTVNFKKYMFIQKMRFDIFELYARKYNKLTDSLNSKNAVIDLAKNQKKTIIGLKKELFIYNQRMNEKLYFNYRKRIDSLLNLNPK